MSDQSDPREELTWQDGLKREMAEPRHLHEYDADAERDCIAENRRLAERCEQLEADRETWLRRGEIVKGLDDWSLAYLARTSPAAAMVLQQMRDALLGEDGA